MAIIAKATFTGYEDNLALTTSDTLDTGQNWIIANGAFKYKSEAPETLEGNAGVPNNLVVVETGISDGAVYATPISGGNALGICFRFVDINNYIYASSRTSDGLGGVTKIVGGVSEQIASTTLAMAGQVLKAVLAGTSIKIYVNDVEKVSLTVSEHTTATKHGIYANFTGSRIDDFTVESASGGTVYNQTVGSATLTPSSSLSKGLALLKTVGQSVITPSGTLSQMVGASLSVGGATLQPIGSLAKRTYKGVGGVITSIGNAVKGLFKSVGGGSVTPSGVVSSQLNPEPPPTVLRTAINWVKKGLKNFFD